jgi:hypothetical protein
MQTSLASSLFIYELDTWMWFGSKTYSFEYKPNGFPVRRARGEHNDSGGYGETKLQISLTTGWEFNATVECRSLYHITGYLSGSVIYLC